MNEQRYRRGGSLSWLFALVAITVLSVVVYMSTYLYDSAGLPGVSLLKMLFEAGGNGALAGMPEVIAGILGISITVVAIIVELAANRYTPRIADLFVSSPTNVGVLGFFVLTGVLCIWVSLTGSAHFTPHAGTVVVVLSVTLCLLMLLPYFAYVFHFLNPNNIIFRMGKSTLGAIRKAVARSDHQAEKCKDRAVLGVEQLADVALNSIENKDKGICMHAVDTLGSLLRAYLSLKDQLPRVWFDLDSDLRENADFISMQGDVLDEMVVGRFWFEMKVLRQYQMLYGETLNRMRDINYLIAINTRKLAEESMSRGDVMATGLAVKFFNTFLRATVNGKDVRTAYNVLNQYRLLAEDALRRGEHEVALEAAHRFKYYGQLGFTCGLPFILETAAYDLCTLNELAFDLKSPCHDEMLATFLDVDKEAQEGHALEASLRGVRKAQIKLATYYLTEGAEHFARTIFDDIRGELPGRLASIRQEFDSITAKDFWEISDRGVNFDYLEPSRRAVLQQFFGWFDELSGGKVVESMSEGGN